MVRFADARDLSRLADIENAADALLIEYLQPEEWPLAPDGIARASMGGFILVVATVEDADPVGFVHVLESDGNAHLEQLSVLPEHGRTGFGRTLVESAMAEAARRGYGSITLRTFATVPWNGPFYRSCGFVESQPESPFHCALEQAEISAGLEKQGRRIQMTAQLSSPAASG